MFDDSEKVFEVGRDCFHRILVNHNAVPIKCTRNAHRWDHVNVVLIAGHRRRLVQTRCRLDINRRSAVGRGIGGSSVRLVGIRVRL